MNSYWKKEMRRLRNAQYTAVPSNDKIHLLEIEISRLVIESIRCSKDAYAVYAIMDAAYDSAKPTDWNPLMGYDDLLKDPNVRFWNHQYKRIKKREKKLTSRIKRCYRLLGNPVMSRKMKMIYEVFTTSP
jgi:hypothetical protein